MKNNEVNEDTKKTVDNNKPNKNKFKISNLFKNLYIDFIGRVVLFFTLFLLLIFSSIFIFFKSFKVQEANTIRYQETGGIDYKVYINENEFFKVPYLANSKFYITSLIKNFDLNFNYSFYIEQLANIDLSYSVVAKLTIEDVSSKNVLYEKEYPLLDTKSISNKNVQAGSISENVTVDYNYYNSIANKFRQTYGIDASSKVLVYMKVNRSAINDEYDINLNSSNLMSFTIPLGSKTTTVTVDTASVNNSGSISKEEKIKVGNVVGIVISIILLIVSIMPLLKSLELVFKLNKKKSKFDIKLSKLLNQYDRLIVDTPTCPNLSNKDIIKILRIEELIDARDNLKRPIMHYVAVPHQKSYFYIESGSTYYLYVLKAVDLEEKDVKNCK